MAFSHFFALFIAFIAFLVNLWMNLKHVSSLSIDLGQVRLGQVRLGQVRLGFMCLTKEQVDETTQPQRLSFPQKFEWCSTPFLNHLKHLAERHLVDRHLANAIQKESFGAFRRRPIDYLPKWCLFGLTKCLSAKRFSIKRHGTCLNASQ